MTETSHNRAGCLVCGGVVESMHVHDYVRCPCGQIAVDGGREYNKRTFTKRQPIELPFEHDLEGWPALRDRELRNHQRLRDLAMCDLAQRGHGPRKP